MEQLMARYEKEIYFHVFRMTRHVEDARDLAQEIFIKAFRKLDGFKGNSSFRTWLYRIATHHTLNFLSRRPPSGSSDPLPDLADPSRPAPETMDRAELSHHVSRAIDRLPGRQKAVVLLKAYEGLTYKEIAQVLECSIGNCKATYHNAIIKLREILKNETIL